VLRGPRRYPTPPALPCDGSSFRPAATSLRSCGLPLSLPSALPRPRPASGLRPGAGSDRGFSSPAFSSGLSGFFGTPCAACAHLGLARASSPVGGPHRLCALCSALCALCSFLRWCGVSEARESFFLALSSAFPLFVPPPWEARWLGPSRPVACAHARRGCYALGFRLADERPNGRASDLRGASDSGLLALSHDRRFPPSCGPRRARKGTSQR